MNDLIQLQTIGGLLGDICEDSYMGTRGMQSAQLNGLVTGLALDAGIDLDDDPMLTIVTPEEERAIYRELAKRYLVRFEYGDPDATNPGMKRCSGCDRDLPISEFYLRRRGQNARQTRCKDCMNAYRVQNRLVHHNSKDIP